MIRKDIYKLDFEIDKLTDSILNTISGDSFQTEVSLLTKSDLKTITKSRGWLFNWKHEFNQPDREVYKLTIIDNPDIVQGLGHHGGLLGQRHPDLHRHPQRHPPERGLQVPDPRARPGQRGHEPHQRLHRGPTEPLGL